MRSWAVGFVAGSLVTWVGSWVMSWPQDYHRELHRHQGEVNGGMEAIRAIRNEFAGAKAVGVGRAIFGVKDEAIVVVVENGVKTVRTAP